MKLSLLARLLAREVSPNQISDTLRAELYEHVTGLRVVGGVAPVHVSEDTAVLLDEHGIATLCELFLAEQLSAQEIAYIADVLQMSERVEVSSSWVADALSEFGDPEINGPMTVARAKQLLDAAG